MNIRIKFLATVVSILAAGLLLQSPYTMAKVSTEVLQLSQSAVDVGQTETFFTRDAVRINLSDTVYLVARAPSWRVVIYNAKTKCGLARTYDQWLTHQPRWPRSFDDDWLSTECMTKIGTAKALGRDCDLFALAARHHGRLVRKILGQDARILTLAQCPTETNAIRILQRALGVPQSYGVPVSVTLTATEQKVSGMTRSHGAQAIMKTTKIAAVTRPTSFFEYPRFSKVAVDEAELLRDSSPNGEVKDFLETFK